MAKRYRELQFFVAFGACVLGIYQHWMLFTCFAFFCTLGCFHDAAHLTLFRRPWLNVLFGRAYGILALLPYTAYRLTHRLHHRRLLGPTDWEVWPYSDPRASLGFRRIYVWIDLVFGCLTGPYVYSRIYWHGRKKLPARVRRAIFWEYAATAIAWSAFLLYVGHEDAWLKFAQLWVIPFMITGAFQTGNKLVEHLGMGGIGPRHSTRNVLPANPISKLMGDCTALSAHLGAHHLHPKDPYIQLEARSRGIADRCFPTHFAAIADMLKACLVRPGSGANATD